ncbi:MAG: hypothetical protein FJ206_01225 [Gemmatimonadetes bacterium]|nr:hypothetical protein [Gemmatimonadota bacterium]
MKSMAWLVLVATLGGSNLAAQEKKDDRFEKAFFDPQLVLRHAREIGLSAQQRATMMDAIKKIQAELVPLQLDMAEPALEMAELIEQPVVDEAAAVAKAEQVLKLENEVKKKQMALLIKIKNVLTKDQQARLRAIRDGGRGDDSDDGSDAANEEAGR